MLRNWIRKTLSWLGGSREWPSQSMAKVVPLRTRLSAVSFLPRMEGLQRHPRRAPFWSFGNALGGGGRLAAGLKGSGLPNSGGSGAGETNDPTSGGGA